VIARRLLDRIADLTNREQAAKFLFDLSLQLDDIVRAINSRGTTAERPVLSANYAGTQYFDTTLGIPIWWNGTAWVNAAGAGV
jgi:hypothetical protein